jgi:hypothetical protein
MSPISIATENKLKPSLLVLVTPWLTLSPSLVIGKNYAVLGLGSRMRAPSSTVLSYDTGPLQGAVQKSREPFWQISTEWSSNSK